MRFILTPKLVTDALSQFASRQQTVGLRNLALGMDPVRFDGVERGVVGQFELVLIWLGLPPDATMGSWQNVQGKHPKT
jgi:hypothetical protein